MEENNSHQEGGGPSTPSKKYKDGIPLQEYRLVPVEESDHDDDGESVVDLIELFNIVWDKRKTVYKFVVVGMVFGVLMALLTTKEYVSYSTLMPEYSTESDGGASSLLKQYGGLIGLSGTGSFGTNSNAIRVDLYPQIVQSLSFQDNLARNPFYFIDYDTTASFYEYYLEIRSPNILEYFQKYTTGLPGTIKNAFRNEDENLSSRISNNNEIVELSRKEMEVIKGLRSRISTVLDEETGIVTVRAKMTNPRLAAQVAKFTIDELTKYLIEYRTEKVINDLDFIEKQLGNARDRFRDAQLELADFDDSNRGTLTARAQTERQRIQSEYDIAFNVYNTLTQQFEEAKLTVQKETPVFKVLQPVQVPVDDEVSGALIAIITTIFSGVVALVWIFVSPIIGFDKSKE